MPTLNKNTGELRRNKRYSLMLTDTHKDKLHSLAQEVGVSGNECLRRLIERSPHLNCL